jgi:hypothetical protein
MSETPSTYDGWPASRGTTEQQLGAMHTMATTIEDLAAKNIALLRVLSAAKARLETHVWGTSMTDRNAAEEWQFLEDAIKDYEEQHGA